jgi:hypothetical protein
MLALSISIILVYTNLNQIEDHIPDNDRKAEAVYQHMSDRPITNVNSDKIKALQINFVLLQLVRSHLRQVHSPILVEHRSHHFLLFVKEWQS